MARKRESRLVSSSLQKQPRQRQEGFTAVLVLFDYFGEACDWHLVCSFRISECLPWHCKIFPSAANCCSHPVWKVLNAEFVPPKKGERVGPWRFERNRWEPHIQHWMRKSCPSLRCMPLHQRTLHTSVSKATVWVVWMGMCSSPQGLLVRKQVGGHCCRLSFGLIQHGSSCVPSESMRVNAVLQALGYRGNGFLNKVMMFAP